MSQSYTSSTILDDTSSNITYTGTWARMTGVPDPYDLYNSTDTWSDRLDDTATLTFWGTSVEYWGNQEDNRGPCEVTLDGKVVATADAYAAVVTGQPKLLYESDTLALAEHVLSIKIISETYPNVCEVDRFVIHTSINVVAASTTTSTVVASSTTSSSSPMSTGTSITSSHTTTSPSSTALVAFVSDHITYTLSATTSNEVVPDTSNISTKSTHQIPFGIIIGSVFAAAALISLLIFLLWLRVRRRRIKLEGGEPFLRAQNSDSDSSTSAITPGPVEIRQVAGRAKRAREFTPILSPVTPDTRQWSDYSDYGTELRQPQVFGSTSDADTMWPVQMARYEDENLRTNPHTISEGGTDGLGLSITIQDPPPAYHEA